jgi:hypothetical protein
MFQTKVAEKIKEHILFSESFFPKNLPFVIMWKNVAEPQVII